MWVRSPPAAPNLIFSVSSQSQGQLIGSDVTFLSKLFWAQQDFGPMV